MKEREANLTIQGYLIITNIPFLIVDAEAK